MSDLNDLERFRGRELSLGGIITIAEHRHTKRGQPFGTFELEDYHGSKKIFLFSEDYLKFRLHLIDGNFVYVKGKVQPRKWGDQNELEFKVNSIDLLTEIRDKLAKNVCISIDLSDLSEGLIETVATLASENEGTCKLKFIVSDHTDKIQLSLPSRSMKVGLTTEFIDGLDKLEGITYSVGS